MRLYFSILSTHFLKTSSYLFIFLEVMGDRLTNWALVVYAVEDFKFGLQFWTSGNKIFCKNQIFLVRIKTSTFLSKNVLLQQTDFIRNIRKIKNAKDRDVGKARYWWSYQPRARTVGTESVFQDRNYTYQMTGEDHSDGHYDSRCRPTPVFRVEQGVQFDCFKDIHLIDDLVWTNSSLHRCLTFL